MVKTQKTEKNEKSEEETKTTSQKRNNKSTKATQKTKSKASKNSKNKKTSKADSEEKKGRYFRVIQEETNERKGRYTGATPKQAASKAYTKLLQRMRKEGIAIPKKPVRIFLRESTQGSAKKIYGYEAYRLKLKTPQTLDIIDVKTKKPKTITYYYRNKVKKIVVPEYVTGDKSSTKKSEAKTESKSDSKKKSNSKKSSSKSSNKASSSR